MSSYQSVFQRYEQKHLLSAAQAEDLLSSLRSHLAPDTYFRSEILSLYFDTPDYRLIRTSLEKPVYREKLRLRSYGVPDPDSPAFLEIKKKYRGIVYKRRRAMTPSEALAAVRSGCCPPHGDHISREIDWLLRFYQTLQPSMVIAYDRLSYTAPGEDGVRLTMDTNIRWRDHALDLCLGADGEPLLEPDQVLMELKTPGALPLWLSNALDERSMYPTSFSKYGRAYLRSHSTTLRRNSYASVCIR